MKKICFLLLLSGWFVAAESQTSPLMIKTLPATVNSAEVETSGGNISISGGTGELKAELYAVPNNGRENRMSEAEIRERLSNDYDVQFEVQGNKLIVVAKSKKKNNWKNGLSISFKLYTPTRMDTKLTTSGGNINLSNVNGSQLFTTSGGNIEATDVAGKIDGTTSGGNISIKHASDDIGLTTSGGNIIAEDCNGKIKLSTSGGNIDLDVLKGEISASTSGGNVNGQTIEGELQAATSGGDVQLRNLSCNVTASTSGGNIKVSVTKLKQRVRLSNNGGNIQLQIPSAAGADLDLSADKIKTETLRNFNGRVEDEKVQGKLNGGGTDIRLRADAGQIILGFN